MSDTPKKRTVSSSKLWQRLMRKEASRTWRRSKQALHQFTAIGQLKEEIALLSHYSADTVYRLRYGTMSYEYISPSIKRLLGYSPEEMKQIQMRDLISETRLVQEDMQSIECYAGLEAERKAGEVLQWQADYRMVRKDGQEIWVSDISYPWFDENGKIIGSIGTLRDVTARVQAEKRLQALSHKEAGVDELTGMVQAQRFDEKIEYELRRIKRHGGEMSLLLLDVDELKQINERYGREFGDYVLQSIARLVRGCMRESDLAARLSGDGLGLILPNTSVEGGYWLAERIRTSIAQHCFIRGMEGKDIGCTVSIGLAGVSADDKVTKDSLLTLAQNRLYAAMHSGKNQVSLTETVPVMQ